MPDKPFESLAEIEGYFAKQLRNVEDERKKLQLRVEKAEAERDFERNERDRLQLEQARHALLDAHPELEPFVDSITATTLDALSAQAEALLRGIEAVIQRERRSLVAAAYAGPQAVPPGAIPPNTEPEPDPLTQETK